MGKSTHPACQRVIAVTSVPPTLEAAKCTIIGPSDVASFPLTWPDGQSRGFLDRNPHLRIRTPAGALFARFRSATLSALADFFNSHHDGPFYQVHLPLLTWTDFEGGAEVFATPTQASKRDDSEMKATYFGSRKYLNVSAVFHAEAFVQGHDRIWTLTPCWRAERADNNRHLAEFWMLEVALNCVESLDPLYQLMKETIHGIVPRLMRSAAGHEILARPGSNELRQRWDKLMTSHWPRIKFSEATELLKPVRAEKGEDIRDVSETSNWRDISEDEEKWLCAHFGCPVFLTHFPSRIRIFQAAQSPNCMADIQPGTRIDPMQTTESFDLLLPGIGEICNGRLREHRLDALVDTMRKKGFLKKPGRPRGEPIPERNAAVDAEPYPYLHPGEDLRSLTWFADIRRWGTLPHGGFRIGFERLLQYLTGADSARDVISFPRYVGVCGC